MLKPVEENFKQAAMAMGFLNEEDVAKAEHFLERDPKGRNFVTVLVGMKLLSKEQVDQIKDRMKNASGGPPPATTPTPDSDLSSRVGGDRPAFVPTPGADTSEVDPDESGETIHVDMGQPADSENASDPSTPVEIPPTQTGGAAASATLDAPDEAHSASTPPPTPAIGKGMQAGMTLEGGDRTVVGRDAPLQATDQRDALLGSTLADCRIEEVLGEGGMGVVYKGLDLSLRRPVAMKVLPRRVVQKSDLVERFHREARAAAQVEHPNIVQVYKVGDEGSLHYIIMQYVKGESLSEKIKREGRLDYRKATRMIYDVARGLAYAHEHGIIHRDIKPDNVMITEKGEVKVADFGLAREVKTDSDISHTGQILGTPYYMSPEQCDGRKVDGRADIYSLGATFYYLLTGTKPFLGDTPYQVILKHMRDPLPDPRTHVPEIPQELVDVLETMMAKTPEDRFESADALVDELENVLRRWEVIDSGIVVAQPRSKLVWIIPVAAVLLLVLVAVAVAIFVLQKQAQEGFEKKAQDAFSTARLEAETQASQDKYLAARRALESFLEEYATSDLASQARDEIKRLGEKSQTRLQNLVEGARAALQKRDLDGADQALETMATIELTPDRASMVGELSADLKTELQEMRALERTARGLPGLLDASPDELSGYGRKLEEFERSKFDDVLSWTAECRADWEVLVGYRRALSHAHAAEEAKNYDRALEVLQPWVDKEPTWVGQAARAEYKKLEVLVREGENAFSAALKKAETDLKERRFTDARETMSPFTSSGLTRVSEQAKVMLDQIADEAERFRKHFQKEVSRLAPLVQKRDWEGAEAILKPFDGSDLADINDALKAARTDISRRRNTPPGTQFIPAGHVASPDGNAVRVGPFYMMRCEVSNREFAEYLATNPGAAAPFGWRDDAPPAGADDLPVRGISLNEAMAYASWLSGRTGQTYRLPTEFEWQWAAAADKGPYPWGEDASALENIKIASGGEAPAPVSATTADASPFGMLHMAGNVSEWTTALSRDGAVVKGGSFDDPDTRAARVDFRVAWRQATGRLPHVGFRLLVEVTE